MTEPTPAEQRTPAPGDPLSPAGRITFIRQEELERVAQGQRRVNLIWEYTQALVAILTIGSAMAGGMFSMYTSFVAQKAIEVPAIISNAAMVIITFYYMRTNHTKMGGIGPTKHDEEDRRER